MKSMRKMWVLLALAPCSTLAAEQLAWSASCNSTSFKTEHPFGALAKKHKNIHLQINPPPTTNTTTLSAAVVNPGAHSLQSLQDELRPLQARTGCVVYLSELKGSAGDFTIHTWRLGQ